MLACGTGICMAKSHLLAALCRSVKIPAGFVYRFKRELEGPEFGLHGLNGIYLDSLGRWIRVDPRGNKPGVNAQFNLDDEQLAFPPDPSKGEAIIDTISSTLILPWWISSATRRICSKVGRIYPSNCCTTSDLRRLAAHTITTTRSLQPVRQGDDHSR